MTSPLRFGQDKTEKSSLGFSMAVDEDVEAQSAGRGSNNRVEEQEEGSDKMENQSDEDPIIELRR